MLYLTCTTITSKDLAHYGVSRAQDWVSVKCGTSAKKRLTQIIMKCNLIVMICDKMQFDMLLSIHG